ncbi:MAG: glycosyltransferase family 87 protein [Pseudomonadota bacterium]
MASPASGPALFGAVTPFTLRWTVRAVAAVFIALLVATFIDLGQPAHRTIFGVPLGGDYVAIRTGAELLEGAYDVEAFQKELMALDSGRFLQLTWQYPPTYFLFIAWIAFLPYAAGYAAWAAANYAVYAAAARPLAPPGWGLALLSAPPVFTCIAAGQNGLAIAGLLLVAGMNPGTRPVLAGLAAGLLTVKPHFGILIPLLWAACGYWRAILFAGATTGWLIILSVVFFGVEPWTMFWARLFETGAGVGDGYYPYNKMITALSAAKLLWAPTSLAMGVQVLSTLFAAGSALLVWKRCGVRETRAAALMLAALLAAPYGYTYDLPVAALALALVAKRAIRTEPLKWEWETIAILWIVSAGIPSLQAATELPFSFAALVAAYWLVLRRAAHDAGGSLLKLKLPRFTRPASGLPA